MKVPKGCSRKGRDRNRVLGHERNIELASDEGLERAASGGELDGLKLNSFLGKVTWSCATTIGRGLKVRGCSDRDLASSRAGGGDDTEAGGGH